MYDIKVIVYSINDNVADEVKSYFAFRKFDYFITLKYAKGTRKDLKEVQADLKKFLYSLRQKYKKKEKQYVNV